MKKIITRFAPSPTGPLHIGTIRTALFPYLFSVKNKGTFILRIEDTDKERSKKEWEDELIKGLGWLGIKWDEGPFRQSEREDLYEEKLKKLIEDGHAYYCFCSKEEVEAQKQYLMSIGEAPVYNGHCRDLPKETVDKYLKEGKPYVIRFKTPVNKIISFNDIIRGKIETNTNTMGDFVIAKDFRNCLFNFTCAVDDMEMKVTHVIRGEDHIPNTPKQILIINALGEKEPEYAHLSLILGTDKKKLSKRTGKTSLSDYIRDGYLPEAILNFIAFLGWNPGTEKEIYTMEGLINDFSLEKIQKSPAIFNIDKLDWLNGLYIRKMQIEELTKACIPYITGIKDEPLEYLVKIVSLYQERLKKLSEINELTDYFFKDKLTYEKELLLWKEMSFEDVKKSLEKIYDVILNDKDILEEANKETNRGNILWPLRAALTGKKNSAGPIDIVNVLGKEKSLKRIKEAIELIK
ncbi:MAG: glutamate--tRNA ligase [Candidatus Pacebacteria bacterium]|nr:glutamate--tRNA ligase [Candidatus Paceibacterota bacterium]